MTPEQKTLIRSSFGALVPVAETVTTLFYHRLFALDPSLRPMFTVSIRRQGAKFMDMLQMVVQSMDNLDEVVPLVWQSGKRHGGYGVREEHYDTVREALLWALAQQLGDQYTPALEAAWVAVYNLLAASMKRAAAEAIIPRPDSVPL